MSGKSDISANKTAVLAVSKKKSYEYSSEQLPLSNSCSQIELNILQKEEDLVIPEVVIDRFEKKKYIASGSFGAVFLALDRRNKQNVVIKVSKRFGKLLFREHKVYELLKGSVGICDLIWFGEEIDWENGGKFTYLVLEYGGIALDKLMKKCNGSFTIFTVLRLGFEILLRIQTFHETAGLIHRDIKPGNFAYNWKRRIIYLIDFGLAKGYSKLNEGKACEKGIGTMEYCSIGSGLGFEQSFRDDLESIGYMLIYFLLGSLPWLGIKEPVREERLRLITNIKMKTKINEVPIPNVFNEYMEYVTNLDFITQPDYEYLRNKFKQYFDQLNIKTNYDWNKYLELQSVINRQ